MGKFFADILTISCGKLQNFVGNFYNFVRGVSKFLCGQFHSFIFLPNIMWLYKLYYETLKGRVIYVRIILSLISNKV
jgi:hypothetical protein